MQTPKFWYKKKSLQSTLLLPLSYIWQICNIFKHLTKKKYSFDIPIICVGNVIAGGAGKTPLIIEICKYYKKKKVNVHVIYKTYKSKISKKVLMVKNSNINSVIEDEAKLISQFATTWVCNKRVDGIIEAKKSDAKFILLDDGFQDFSIKKKVNILVSNKIQGNGNSKIIPAGPLRETIKSATNRSDCIFFYGDKHECNKIFKNYRKKKYFGKLFIKHTMLKKFYKKKIIAYAGIAHPDNFFELLSSNGLDIQKKLYFPDHYQYKRDDLKKIISLSKDSSTKILTTAKDYVKIPKDLKKYISAIDIKIKFESNGFFNYINKEINLDV